MSKNLLPWFQHKLFGTMCNIFNTWQVQQNTILSGVVGNELAEVSLHARVHSTMVLTPWLMKPGGSMPHSKGPSNNPYPEPNQSNSSY